MGNESLLVKELTGSQALNVTITFVALAVILPLALCVWNEWLAFMSLGPGGTPKTVGGFLRVQLLSFCALHDPYKPASVPERFEGQSGFLVNLAKRQSPRPCTRGIAPHRQITQKGSPADFERLRAAIEALANANETMVVGTSCFEKHGTGLFCTSPAKRTCRGEVVHAHPSDGSMHLTLHPADSKAVLEAGWGERHPIARGGWFERFVPGGFVMVYAPTSDEELDAVMRIVRAAAWFVSGGVEGGSRDS